MKRAILAAAALVVAGGLVLAAGRGAKGNGQGGGGIDLSTLRTVTGTVTDVSIAKGIQHPSFLLTQADGTVLSVELGPYWFLVANDFALAVGDQASADVANCAKRSSSDVLAFSVTDLTTGAAITLRDSSDGDPLWRGGRRGTQGQGHRGGGQGQSGACYASASQIDLSTLQEVEGQVTAVNFGLGTHRNTVTLQAGGGGEYTVALGPFWYMNQQGFTFEEGQAVRVRMAQCAQGWVAFSVEVPSSGATLTLRDDQGLPLWNA